MITLSDLARMISMVDLVATNVEDSIRRKIIGSLWKKISRNESLNVIILIYQLGSFVS